MISSQSKELSFLFTIDARWWSSTWFSCWSVILSSWILWWLKVYIISELLWIVKFHLSVAFEIIRKRSDRDTDHWRTALCYRDHPRKSNSFLRIYLYVITSLYLISSGSSIHHRWAHRKKHKPCRWFCPPNRCMVGRKAQVHVSICLYLVTFIAPLPLYNLPICVAAPFYHCLYAIQINRSCWVIDPRVLYISVMNTSNHRTVPTVPLSMTRGTVWSEWSSLV